MDVDDTESSIKLELVVKFLSSIEPPKIINRGQYTATVISASPLRRAWHPQQCGSGTIGCCSRLSSWRQLAIVEPPGDAPAGQRRRSTLGGRRSGVVIGSISVTCGQRRSTWMVNMPNCRTVPLLCFTFCFIFQNRRDFQSEILVGRSTTSVPSAGGAVARWKRSQPRVSQVGHQLSVDGQF